MVLRVVKSAINIILVYKKSFKKTETDISHPKTDIGHFEIDIGRPKTNIGRPEIGF